MKTLLFISINDHVPWGGSEELWSQTAIFLANNHNIKILIREWNNDPEPIKKLKSLGADVFYKQAKKISFAKKFTKKILKKLLKVEFNRKHDLHQTEIGKPELAVISLGNHLDTSLFYYTNYLTEHQIPYVIIFQLVTDLRGLTDEMMDKFRQSYERALRLYFLSEDNCEKLEMLLSSTFINKYYLNNPFNYYQDYVPLKLPDNTYYHLAVVASLNSLHKGHDILLKVLSQDKWKNRPLIISLYGRGHNEKQIIRLIEMYGLRDKVILKGFITNRNEIWENNHGLILTSRMEGQSLAMLEAMSFGRMVISTKVGDAQRLIEDGKNGFLIEAPTFDLVDTVMERAWQKRENWLQMGEKCREKLFKEITIDPIIDFSNKLQSLLS